MKEVKKLLEHNAFLALAVHMYDVISDWAVLIQFGINGEWPYFGLSLSLILLTAFVSSQMLLSFHSYETWLGVSYQEFHKGGMFNKYKLPLYFGSIFQLGILVEFRLLQKSENRASYFLWQKLCEALLEAFPQMILQFVFFFSKGTFTWEGNEIIILSLIGSICSASWALMKFESMYLQLPDGYKDYKISLLLFRLGETLNRTLSVVFLLVSESIDWYWKLLFFILEAFITTYVYFHTLPSGMASMFSQDSTRWADPSKVEQIRSGELPKPKKRSVLLNACIYFAQTIGFGFLCHAFALPDYVGPFESPDELQGIFVGWFLILRGISSAVILFLTWDEYYMSFRATVIASWFVCIICAFAVNKIAKRLIASKALPDWKITPWGDIKMKLKWFLTDWHRRKWMAENYGLLQYRLQIMPFWVTVEKYDAESHHKHLKVLIEKDEFYEIAMDTTKRLMEEGRPPRCNDY